MKEKRFIKRLEIPKVVIISAFFVLLFSGIFSFFVLDHIPHIHDEIGYLFQAKIFTSGHLYAGLSSGDIWHTQDYGDNWVQLPINLGGIHSTMIMFKSKNGDNDV